MSLNLRKLSKVQDSAIAEKTASKRVADSKVKTASKASRIQDSARELRAKRVADARAKRVSELRAKRIQDSKIFSLKKRIKDSESTEEAVEVVTTAVQEGEVEAADAIKATIEVLGGVIEQLDNTEEPIKDGEGNEEISDSRRRMAMRARRVSDARRRMALRNRKVADSKSRRTVVRRK